LIIIVTLSFIIDAMSGKQQQIESLNSEVSGVSEMKI
jgi:hypothetical protein